MSTSFGDIRELVQRGASADPYRLAEMLWRARCAGTTRYDTQILPYLEGFELPVFEFTARWQLERLDVLLPAQSLIRWRLDDAPGSGAQIEMLLGDELLERVTELHIRMGAYLDTASVCALMRSTHLGRLSVLRMGGTELGSQVLYELARSSSLTALCQLSIENSSYHHTLLPGMRALLDGPIARQLTHLSYAPYSLSEGGDCAVHLIASSPLNRLHHLRLRGYNDQLELEAASALANAAFLAQLTSLDLSCCELAPEVLAELVGAPGCARLESLNLGDNDLGGEGIRVLARAPHLHRLNTLNLWKNRLQNAGFEQVLRSPLMAQLQVLNVRSNWISAPGMQAVRDVAPNRPLRVLWMGHNMLGDAGAKLLFESTLCEHLDCLGVQSNGIESSGFRAIEAMDGHLGELLLDFNEPGESGVGALARSRATRRLHRLSLMWCVIEDEGLDALGRAACVRRLRQLDLSHNGLSTPAMVRFIKSAGVERLERLSVAGNRLGDDVIATMLEADWFERLTRLDVRQNRLGLGAIERIEHMDAQGDVPEIEYAGNAHEERMALAVETRRSFLGRAIA